MKKGAKQAIDSVNGKTDPNDVVDNQAQRSLKTLSIANAASSAKTSQKNLRRTINKVLKDEGTIDDLARAIRKQYAVDSRTRSLLIARTEMTGVMGKGNEEGLKAEGVQIKRWITAIDGRQRDSHAIAHNQEVPVGQDFVIGSGRGAYPGDSKLPVEERVNCRCTTVAANVPKRANRIVAGIFLRVHGRIENRYRASLRREFIRQRNRVLERLSKF